MDILSYLFCSKLNDVRVDHDPLSYLLLKPSVPSAMKLKFQDLLTLVYCTHMKQFFNFDWSMMLQHT